MVMHTQAIQGAQAAQTAQPSRRVRPCFRWSLLVAMVILMIGLSGCSEPEPTEFTDDTRSGFMAACRDEVTDSEVIGDVCECVFESTQEEMVFTQFATIDQQLVENPDSPLSSEVIQFVADCVITAADL